MNNFHSLTEFSERSHFDRKNKYIIPIHFRKTLITLKLGLFFIKKNKRNFSLFKRKMIWKCHSNFDLYHF